MTAADKIAEARALIEPLTGYTPGPWKAWQPRHDESVPVRTDGLGITIAYVHQGAVTHAGDNARLIVAAPELVPTVATLADALEAERAKVAAAHLEGWRAGREAAAARCWEERGLLGGAEILTNLIRALSEPKRTSHG